MHEASALQYDVFRTTAPIVAVLLAALFVACLRPPRGQEPRVRNFPWYIAMVFGYLATNWLEMMATSEAQTLFWSKALYPFAVCLPLIWLDLSLRFARQGRGMSVRAWIFLLIVPVATVAIVFIDPLSRLMWSSIEYVHQGDYVISRRVHGLWFWPYVTFSYGVFFSAAIIAIRSIIHYRTYYKRQTVWILLGIAFPGAMNIIFVLGLIPGLTKDYSAYGDAVASFLFYIALYRRDVFSLAPVGRSLIVERLGDGVLVFGPGGRLADANPAAMRMLGFGEELLGSAVAGDEGPLPSAVVEAVSRVASVDFLFELGGKQRSYRVEASRIEERGRDQGVLAVVKDETEHKALLMRVAELAMIDELTGLRNRRCFMAEAERELARARRHGTSVSAAMIDMDGFKRINDEFGHAAGDAALKGFGAIAASESRSDDIVGRLGGDEFAIISSEGPNAADLRSLCERIRSRLGATDFEGPDGRVFRVTISVGLASRSSPALDLGGLLAEADSALYLAKGSGRDTIMSRKGDSY
jgi:diguanylate cyclase (GGDEF) domain